MIKEQSITCWIGEDLAVDVLYEYTPEEPAIYYPAEKAYPGCGEEIIVNQVLVNNSDILECLTQKVIDKIEDDINEFMRSNTEDSR